MSILDELREEATTRANTCQNTVLARVLSVKVSDRKTQIDRVVGVTHQNWDDSSYSKLLTRRLQVKMKLRLLEKKGRGAYYSAPYAMVDVTEQTLSDLEQILKLRKEFQELTAACEAARKSLFYQGDE